MEMYYFYRATERPLPRSQLSPSVGTGIRVMRCDAVTLKFTTHRYGTMALFVRSRSSSLAGRDETFGNISMCTICLQKKKKRRISLLSLGFLFQALTTDSGLSALCAPGTATFLSAVLWFPVCVWTHYNSLFILIPPNK